MPKETERQIRTETEYISRNGQIYKKVTTYSLLSNAKLRVENDDSPTIEEFKDVVLNKDENTNKDGYIASKS
jgi:hypothetical protein